MVNHLHRPAEVAGPVLDGLFGAMSSPARRAMLRRLARGDATVGELARPLAMSAPAVSRHLRVLEAAGMIERHRVGRVHHIRLQRRAFAPAAQFMAGFWTEAFDALEAHLEDTEQRGE